MHLHSLAYISISGGCEAAVHAARPFIENMPRDYVRMSLPNWTSLTHSTTWTEMSCYSQYLTNFPPFTSFVIYVIVSQLNFLRYGSETILSQNPRGNTARRSLRTALLLSRLVPTITVVTKLIDNWIHWWHYRWRSKVSGYKRCRVH